MPSAPIWNDRPAGHALRQGFARLTLMSVICSPLGCSTSKTTSTAAENSASAAPPAAPEAPPLPTFEGVRCRVYSSEPGDQVFVDGIPVRDGSGNRIETPCVVTAGPGIHTVSIARPGRADQSQQLRFEGDPEVVFESDAAEGGQSALLAAPLLNLAQGSSIPLQTVNSPDVESDPFVTPDGRSLWFVSDRAGIRGVYSATRAGPLDEFSEPRLLPLSRGSDMLASPSLTADEQSVVYVDREKARVWEVTRSSPLADFDDHSVLYFSDTAGERWLSGQITGDGLRLYFVREAAGQTETRVVSRDNADDRFSGVLVVNMPGLHPCLSSDGLRQFIYDGQTLSRARRTSLTVPFSPPEKVRELALEGYRPSSRHRQFFVSDDEQWMFYCDDPEGTGDLYVVRLSEGPAWGVVLRGESIEPRRVVAASAPQNAPDTVAEPTGSEPVPEEKPVDPRALPWPYAQFRTALLALLAERRFAEAAAAVAAARDNQDLATVRDLVDWDAADVQILQQFWTVVDQAVSRMKPGDQYRDGSLKLEFIRYADGILVGKARTREVERPLAKLDSASLVELAERAADPMDRPTKMQIATLYVYDPGAVASTRNRKFADAGEAGKQLAERLALRLIREAEWELPRGGFAAALELIGRVEQEHAGTDAVAAAVKLRERLYTQFEWRRVGKRTWQTGPDGEYAASAEREEGSVLMSPQQYSQFELSFEYRTTGQTGQGGVFFRYPGSGKFYNRCFKIQLSNDKGVNPDPYCTGALFSITAPSSNAAGNDGDWNTFRMQVAGESVKVWINGRLIQDTTAVDNQIPASGHVALDGIAGGIAYRKVLLSGEE